MAHRTRMIRARGGNPSRPAYLPDQSGCWLWQGELDTKGYGMVRKQVNHARSVKRAHRVIYEEFRGPIPEGLELDHLCRVPACVNPGHLEPVTHRVNVRRALLRTHCMRGHQFTPENSKPMPKGKRTCRTCFNAAQLRYLARKKAREEAA